MTRDKIQKNERKRIVNVSLLNKLIQLIQSTHKNPLINENVQNWKKRGTKKKSLHQQHSGYLIVSHHVYIRV